MEADSEEPASHAAAQAVSTSLRAEVGLNDGRTVVFEAKRQGQNKANADVVADMKNRCTVA